MSSTFLVTSSVEFQAAAGNELRQYDPKLQVGSGLAPGLFPIVTALSEADFAAAIGQPIYVRHLFPVQRKVELADLDRLAEVVLGLPALASLPKSVAFSVQARLLSPPGLKYPYSAYALKSHLVPLISQRCGGQENIQDPEYVFSVVCVEGWAYLGLSPVAWNLSAWPGGMRRFAKLPEQISRAELKLLEALEVFGLGLPTQGKALDLGAAPGGWTRILLTAGLSVTAIDPAQLDPRLGRYPQLKHHRGYAQTFLERALRDEKQHKSYALIASDLRMDALLSAQVIADYAPLLADDGLVIATLKLPHATAKLNPVALARQALQILGQTYAQVRARQLFHNRQEITVLARWVR